MKTPLILILLVLLFVTLPDYWYMAPEQRIRFTKIDSLNAQYDALKNIYKADPDKYDSVAPLMNHNLDVQSDILIDAGNYIDEFYTIGK